MAKIRVEELAAQMGVGTKEVLFLLQSIGVDVKSPQAALDEAIALDGFTRRELHFRANKALEILRPTQPPVEPR